MSVYKLSVNLLSVDQLSVGQRPVRRNARQPKCISAEWFSTKRHETYNFSNFDSAAGKSFYRWLGQVYFWHKRKKIELFFVKKCRNFVD